MNLHADSPGKINLFLDVTGKRESGYHDILTLFLPSSLSDTITVQPAQQLTISCSHPSVPTDEKNLCWQAAEIFARESKLLPNWEITIDKKLPVAGGMGGGSSNAGTLLKLLAAHYKTISHEQLKEIALSIGADVPFFLNPKPAIAAGVGEELEFLETKNKIPMLIVTFGFPISAAWAYQHRKLDFSSSKISLTDLKEKWDSQQIFDLVYNDLAHAIRDKFSLLEMTRQDLLDNGAKGAEVSGSGPSLFALFDTEESRDHCLAQMLVAEIPRANLFPCFAG